MGSKTHQELTHIMRSLLFLSLIFFTNLSFAQLQFTDVASSVGADYTYGTSMFGGGVSFVDFNNDGWDDLTYSTDETDKIHFLRNDGGTFTKIVLAGIDDEGLVKQVLWVDYDNDGDKDFFMTNMIGQNRLYENEGNLVFTDVTDTSGLFSEDLHTNSATFGDIDKDGDLDLFLINWEGDTMSSVDRNYLYRNDNGIFTDITVDSGLDTFAELSLGGSFFDYDNDGDQDLFMINDRYTYQNRLYQNDGTGQFTDVSLTSGTAMSFNAMSSTIGDYNADGWFDIYITNTPEGNTLLKNNGDGTFTDVADTSGTIFDSFGWGAVFLDADNDTNLDLYVSGPFDGTTSGLLPSAFYHNEGDDTFTIPDNIGFGDDTLASHSNAIGDYNNDGKADIVVMNDNSESYFLWSNNSTNTNNWIKIKLEGVVSNKDGIGNKIEVNANGKSQYRYTVCGEGYLGQNSSSEFVGIGDAFNIDYIKVTWNTTGQVETINNVPPNQTITIQEGNGILSSPEEDLLEWSVYPNPSASGIFKINRNVSTEMEISVMDVQCKNLFKQRTNTNEINLSNLSDGVYFLRIQSGNQVKVHKLIKN